MTVLITQVNYMAAKTINLIYIVRRKTCKLSEQRLLRILIKIAIQFLNYEKQPLTKVNECKLQFTTVNLFFQQNLLLTSTDRYLVIVNIQKLTVKYGFTDENGT